ncbi:MAG: transglycosylase domain-containing protein [Polyangiaceae bacterium]|nr:transglycosylase domain-containing protein [Polyangiaceae bacterium]
MGSRAEVVSRPSPLRRAGRVLARLAALAALLAGVSSLAVVLVVRHYEAELPSVEQLQRGYDPPQVTRVIARDGTPIGSLYVERRTVIELGQLPEHVRLAFLAAEDATFYEHEGLDYLGMVRALVANLRAGRTVQGGSTITQQVVKNLLLDPERTYARKLKETILARRLEQHLTKDRIFALYLNHIYLGHGRWGVEEAARSYFGVPARSLDLAQAALLAGIVAAPERYSPRHAPEKALARRAYVLGQMLEKGFITAELHRAASGEAVRLAASADDESALAPEVVEHVRALLRELVGERAKLGGFTVTTTLDPRLQASARSALRQGLDDWARRQRLTPPLTLAERRLWGKPFRGTPTTGRAYVGTVAAVDDAAGTLDVRVGDVLGRIRLAAERGYFAGLRPSALAAVGASLRVRLLAEPGADHGIAPLALELGPEGAVVAIEPRTREVRALVGGRAGVLGALDRATQARRQPASAFKPFVYAYALRSRAVTPATVLELGAAGDGGAPRRLAVRDALARSDNLAAERLLALVGASAVVTWAGTAGIESRLDPTPSLALGAYEVRPIELVNAYATFAAGGGAAPWVLVTRVVGPDGREIPVPRAGASRRALTAAEAHLTTSLLASVVERGTATRARTLGRALAGKTGTSNDARDAWFVGYSPELVAGVWVGFDDPLSLGAGESGAATALPVWIGFMKDAHAGVPPTTFVRPPGVVAVRLDPATGLLPYEGQPDTVEELLLEGTAPTEHAAADAGAAEAGADAGADAPAAASDEEPAPALEDAGAPPGPAAPPATASAAPGHDRAAASASSARASAGDASP